jgi:hypothetical protein
MSENYFPQHISARDLAPYHEPEPTEAAPRLHCGCLENQPHTTSCPTAFGDKSEREAVVGGQPPKCCGHCSPNVPTKSWACTKCPLHGDGGCKGEPETPRPEMPPRHKTISALLMDYERGKIGITDMAYALYEAGKMATVPQELSADLLREVEICEQNGTKWAHFKVSDIRALLKSPPSSLTQAGPHVIKAGKYVPMSSVEKLVHAADMYQDLAAREGSEADRDAATMLQEVAAQSQKGGGE